MKVSVLLCSVSLGLFACHAVAAEQPTMVISGVGQVLTPPDVAKATFNVRGEGTSPDAATSALVKAMDAIRGGLGRLPNAELNITTDEMRVQSVRGEDCGTRYDEARLSTGPCAVMGYVATLEMKAEVSPAEEVGTMLGLASRLGADSTSVAEFDLRDPSDAQRRATALALGDAQKKAQMIADGAGVKLGSVVNVTDSEALTMNLRPPPGAKSAPAGPTNLQPRPPVAVALRPEFVVTKAQLVVTYAILPK